MKKLIAVLLVLMFCGCMNTMYANVSPEIRDIYAASVSVLNSRGGAMGAGTIIHNKRGDYMMVLTAAHVVATHEKYDRFVDILYKKSEYRKMSIYRFDTHTDLALLMAVKKEESNGPYVDIANVGGKIGERIWVIGAPLGEKKTVTRGIISNRINTGPKYLYRTDAEVFFGNSGGGMFNDAGQLIGVLHAIHILRLNKYCLMLEPGGHYAIAWKSIRNFIK